MAALLTAGFMSDRVGPRGIALAGIALSVAATLPFAAAGTGTGGNTTLLAGALALRGAGLGAAGTAMNAAAYHGIPRHVIPRATSLLNVIQRVGASFGTAMLAVLLQRRIEAHPAVRSSATLAADFGYVFGWTVAFAALAILPALGLPNTRPPAQQ